MSKRYHAEDIWNLLQDLDKEEFTWGEMREIRYQVFDLGYALLEAYEEIDAYKNETDEHLITSGCFEEEKLDSACQTNGFSEETRL